MPEYVFKCRACQRMEDRVFSMDDVPAHISHNCGGTMTRVYTAPVFHLFKEHFNHSLGRPLGSKKDFKTALYEAQEKMTERLGWQQHYVEAEPTRVNDEGMDVTHDSRKAMGLST